ncbi:MAG: chromosome segregation protein SMC [Balneolales bacterium]
MYLSELELHGFKSFAQKTKVKFDSGLTAIVGPNGCGKSNIVDALRWSLGEQRPSLLRSAAMTNVIFNGTASKKALGMAEVSLTIQNNKGILPTEYTDVTITRRLYRSGDSEYLLNNSPCRLKDIVELFMDTGMGSNAYSVIELKMVEEILNDKNNDRRKLFEEAAGITRYKERKKQTLRKLDETRGDMRRVEDILFEVRKKTRSLQMQASKAERAKNYEQELHKLDLAVARHEYTFTQNELEPLNERIVNATTAKDDLNRKVDELEQSETRAQQVLLEHDREENEAQKVVNRIYNKLKDSQTTLKITNEKIKNEKGVIQQFEQDIIQSETDIRDMKKSGREAGENLVRGQEELEKATTELADALEVYERYEKEVNESRRNLDEANQEYQKTSQAINQLQTSRIRIESRMEGNEEDQRRVDREIKEKNSNIENFTSEQPDFDSKLSHAISERENADAALIKVRTGREELLAEQNKLKDELRRMNSRHDALQSEISLLQSIAESNEAFPSSVQYLQKQKNDLPDFQVLSDLLSTSENYAVALESVLGEACNFIVVEKSDEARQIVELLKQEKKGKTTIIPLDRLASDYSVGENTLYHNVKCEEKYEAVKRLFLGDVKVVETLDDILRSKSENGAYVSKAGDVISKEGILNSGSVHKNVGTRVGLKDKLKALAAKARNLTEDIEEADEDLLINTRRYREMDVHAAEKAAKETTAALQRLESKKDTVDAQKKIYEKSLEDLHVRKTKLESSLVTMKQELEELQPEHDELQESMQHIVRRQLELKSEVQKREESLQRSQNKHNEIKLRHRDSGNKVENIKKDIERSESGIEEVKKRLDQRAENARQSKDKILAFQKEIEETEVGITELEKELAEASAAHKEMEMASSRQRGKINLLEESLKENRSKKETNLELLHSLDMTKSRYDMELKRITDYIWETYALMADQIEEDLPEDTDVSTAKETIFTIKQRLKNIGTVNPLAIEEYEEEKQRLEQHESQIADLVEAEQKLTQTIEEINNTAMERFNQTFEAIRKNFKEVFSTLFNEDDECDLVPDVNNDDVLESKIEIIAKPRGKRPSTIEQLSGGEKTLTAIALLFAIYLVKPSPFCILDEVDAPLDDANIERFTKLLKRFSKETQFIVITHNKKTMEKAELMYGVTMPEIGISKLVGVRLDDVEAE